MKAVGVEFRESNERRCGFALSTRSVLRHMQRNNAKRVPEKKPVESEQKPGLCGSIN
jgi:hypothetical protein